MGTSGQGAKGAAICQALTALLPRGYARRVQVIPRGVIRPTAAVSHRSSSRRDPAV